jgi:hypothetical protein
MYYALYFLYQNGRKKAVEGIILKKTLVRELKSHNKHSSKVKSLIQVPGITLTSSGYQLGLTRHSFQFLHALQKLWQVK